MHINQTITILSLSATLFLLPQAVSATTYTVAPGDTLFKIARMHNVSMQTIMTQNNLATDKLSVGQALVVSGAVAQTPTPEPAPASSQAKAPTNSTSPTKATVTVATLNARTAPSLTSPIVAKLPLGTTIDVVDNGTEWTKITYQNREAYVSSLYITFDTTRTGATTPATLPSIPTNAPAYPTSRSGAVVVPAPTLSGVAPTLPSNTDSIVANGMTKEALYQLVEPLLGTPYVLGGTTTAGFDCSGFTSYVYKLYGITLPRTSDEQVKYGQEIPLEQAQPGDLLFYDTLKKGKVSHVSLYLGDNIMVHANGSTLRYEKLENMQKLYPFYGVKRYTK